MTTTPTFDDLTPPDALVHQWQWCECERPSIGSHKIIAWAARWGARHGWEQARQLWPTPITDRPPTAADADERGNVQYLANGTWYLANGTWQAADWEVAASHAWPWLHTPRWQPRQPSLQEQAIAAADEALQPANLSFTLQNADRLVAALSLCRRALEQAGEGVE